MSPPPDDDPRRPRGAVRSHLRKLMAATAAVGLAAATTRSGSATTPTATATTTTTTKTDAGVSDANGDAADIDAAEASIPVVCGPDERAGEDGRCYGYAVVNPLPPPARGCGCHKEPGMASGPDPDPVE